MFIFSLKQPLFDRLQGAAGSGNPSALTRVAWQTNALLDRLGLYTTEVFQRGRDRSSSASSRS